MAKRNVYVIDDEEPIRKALKLMLTVSGYSVAAFDCGAALLNVAGSLVPGSLLLDVRMPDMDGIEVQRQLLERGLDLPVVLMTGHGDLSVANAAFRQGAVAFLEKPFAKPALTKALESAFLKLEDPGGYRLRLSVDAAAVDALGEEDRALLAGLATGQPFERIAGELGLTPALAELRRNRLYAGLGIEGINDALRFAFAADLGPRE